jgi:hypothetical protein
MGHGQPPAYADNCKTDNKKICLQGGFVYEFTLGGEEDKQGA